METLYRLSYWGLLRDGNEIEHTLNSGIFITTRGRSANLLADTYRNLLSPATRYGEPASP
ncbi:hypothetical protein [Streptomyces sp. NPDC005181]|uniref:hypothetical protein n=1 Tax=Streptomyces sp. NPDC005181 TaxID=3156869 RepID=UPI0033BF25A2